MPPSQQTQNALQKATALFRVGDLAGAEKAARAVVKAAPAQANQLLAGIALKRGDLEAGESHAKAAVDAAPGSANLLLNLATIQFSRNKRDEALAAFALAAQTAPKNFEAQLGYGKALAEAGQLEEAVKQFTRAHNIAPHPRAKGPLADALFRLERFDEAEEWASAALASGLDTAELHCLIGKIRLASGKPGKAVPAFESSLAKESENLDALMGLSCAKARQRDIIAARDATRRYLEIRPVARTGAPAPHAHVAVAHFLERGHFRRARYGHSLPAGGNYPSSLQSERLLYHHCYALPFLGGQGRADGINADLVVNNIVNAEQLDIDALKSSAAMLERFEAPVVNDLDAVQRSSRFELFTGLGSSSDFVVPKILAFRAEGAPEKQVSWLAGEFDYPFILRAASSHRGSRAQLITGPDEARQILVRLVGSSCYAIQYFDCSEEGGFARMFRATSLDGEFFSDRVNFSPGWSSHGDESRDPEVWRERGFAEYEKRYLEDPEDILGKPLATLFKPIDEFLGLDVYGVDFGIDREGRIILFEANASMNLFNRKHVNAFSYKKLMTDAFFAKLDQWLLDKALAARG